MSGISGKDSFDHKLQELTGLLQNEPPPSLEDARIKMLSASIFAYIQEHSELERDPRVQQLSQRIQQLMTIKSSSTEGKTGSVASHSAIPPVYHPPSALGASAAISPPPPPPTSARLLFNLFADEFGGNSKLEGIPLNEVLRYVIDYIKGRQSLDPSFITSKQSILTELEMADRIQRDGLSSALLAPLLAGDKPFLIPGGWIGLPMGHYVYYEVFPQADGTVNFRIFNTGAGIDEHPKVQVGVKQKVAFLEWRGISKEKLLDPYFAQIIEEMGKRLEYPNLKDPANPKRTEYKADDIYQSLKYFLEPTSIEAGLKAPLMEPQRAGTCACRSLFAFIKSKLPLEEYQRLKLDLRMQALTHYISEPLESGVSPEIQYQLVEKATKKLSLRVYDLYDKVIGKKDVVPAEEQLRIAEKWLNDHRISKKNLSMDHTFTSPMNPLVCDQALPMATLLATPYGIPSREIHLSDIIHQISLHPLNDPSIFTENIQKVSELLQAAYEKREYTAVHFAITSLMKTIPMGEIFWEAARKPGPEIEKAITYLGALSELFFKSCYRIQNSSAVFCEKEHTLRKILLSQQKLAQLLTIRIALPESYRSLDSQQNFYVQDLDPLFTNELRSAFPEDYSQPPFFFSLTFDSSYYNISKLCCEDNSDSPFSILIKEAYPEVLRKIRQDDPAFDTKNLKNQATLLFTSSHLPPWIQSIKKSIVSLAYMQNLPIVPLTDPTVSLDFRYEDALYNCFISLEGITPANFIHLPSDKERVKPSVSMNQTPIKHPMIQEIVSLVPTAHWTEKVLLSGKESGLREELQYLTFRKKYSPPFTEREIDQLVHIFSNPRYSLIEALEYFTLHSEKLSDLDYQQLFQMTCFYFKTSNKIREFTGQIFQFLTKQMSLSIHVEDIKTQVFLQRMGRYFTQYGCEAPDITTHLEKLLKDATIKPEEKSLIYAELAAALSENKAPTRDQLTLLLTAKAWIEHIPIPLEWKDPKTIYDIEKALCIHSAALMELILPAGRANTEVLNQIYTLINERDPPRDITWQIAHSPGMSPRFTSNNNDFYDPMSGQLITIGQEAYIPLEIQEDFIFKQLFPGQVKAIARSRDAYEFSLDGIPVLVKKKPQGLSIEQYIEGQWLRLIPSSKLITSDQDNVTSALESRYLVDKYHVWHSITEPTKIFLYDKKTRTKTYEVLYNSTFISQIRRLSDGALLSKSSDLLSHFEHPSYIQEWYEGTKRIEIELPRFKLSFKPDADGRLQSQEHEGFFLNENQNLEAIGSCTYALILKNGDGETRVVLPYQHLQAPISNESLAPNFRRDQCLEKGQSADFNYFTYDLQPNGYLESSSQEGYFHLAETLAVYHHYQKAAHYLRTYGEKLSPYSMREIQALTEIANIKKVTGDKSGEQVAIALYANYLLATNEIHSLEALEALPSLYEQYLKRLRNVTALRLSKEEELHLLKSLFPESLSTQFSNRLDELLAQSHTPNPPEDGEVTTQPKPAITININELRSLIFFGTATPLPPHFKKSVLITRPADFIKMYLQEMIKIAIHGSPPDKIKWIETACLFLKTNTQDPTNASLGILLEQILRTPHEFTLPPDSSSPSAAQANLLSWWEEILTKAKALQSPEVPPPTRAPSLPVDRPRAHPTDRAELVIPDYPFRFTPQVIGNLCEDPAVSTWTTPLIQPISVNRELTRFLSSQSSEDPVELAEWARLVEDAEALYRKPPKTLYTLLPDTPEITSVLRSKKDEIKGALTNLEQRILSMAATPPRDSTARALFHLQKRGRQLQEITLDDIFISLGSKDPKKLLAQNPHLRQEDLDNLYLAAATYLQIASHRDQVDRSLSLCKKIAKDPHNQDLRQELGQELNAKRCYDISQNPEYLVFEYYAGIIMREDQVGKLESFIRGEEANPVMEMIMGSGKSKVLLPLLCLLRADGRALSMVVMPAPLFESVSSDTQAIHQKAYAKSLKALHFDRNSTFTLRSLKEIKTFLETVTLKKQCLIMTSKSIQSFMLKFIEYANTLKEAGASESEEFKLMIGIISLLQQTANLLIDEADTVLNVLHEVSFSLGQRVPPKEEEIQLIGTLYGLLYSDPTLKHIARLESDPHPDTDAAVPPLSEGLYHERLKKTLASALIAELIEQKKLLMGIEQEAVLAYLCRDESKKDASEKFFAAHPELQNLLALAAEEICSLIPHTLLKTSDERYGLDRGVIAIPYAAANTPSHGSLFSNPYITMNYTFQIHTKNGIKEDTLIRVIEQLKKQSDTQMRDEQIELEKTIGYQQFCLLKGQLPIPFKHHLDPSQLTLILNRINSDPIVRQNLIEKLFLPQMQLFEKKLACNPINLIALFSKVSGFTGTLWNAGSMHSKLQPQPEAGTDAKTLNLLIEKSSGPALIIPKVEGASMFDSLPPHDALIDAGGYFKEGGNLAIARKMAISLGKPVVFYNSEGVQTITDGKDETPLSAFPIKEENRLTFYDQSHTTGADIKQKGAARGLVTIGRGMILRDLLQSVWRLRGLEKGQTVQFVIDEEVASIIKAQLESETEAIGFKEILKFVIQNQAKQQGDDNFKSFKQQLDNLSQNLLLEVMTNLEYSAEQKQDAFQELCKTWIKPANQLPSELYGKPSFERPSQAVIEEAAHNCSVQLDAIGVKIPFLRERISLLKAEIAELTGRALPSVHRQVISPQSETDSTVEQAQANEVGTQVSTEMESEGNNQFEPIQLGFILKGFGKRKREWEHVPTLPSQSKFKTIPLFPIADQMKREPGLKSYQDLFEGIDISINVLAWKINEEAQIDKMRLLGARRTPFHHLLVEGDTVTLFSQIDDTTSHPDYYNLTLGFKDPERKLSPAAFEKVVKIKFLNGESTFNREELAFLERWVREVGVDKIQTLYLKHILKFQPDKKLAFKGSNLDRLFKKLKT